MQVSLVFIFFFFLFFFCILMINYWSQLHCSHIYCENCVKSRGLFNCLKLMKRVWYMNLLYKAVSSIISIEESEGTSFFLRAAAALRLLLLFLMLGEKWQTAVGTTHLQYTLTRRRPSEDGRHALLPVIHSCWLDLGTQSVIVVNDSHDNDEDAAIHGQGHNHSGLLIHPQLDWQASPAWFKLRFCIHSPE